MATELELLTIAEGIAARPGHQIKDNAEDVLKNLRLAILERKEVFLTYSGRRHSHTIQPYGFLYGHRNYLVTRIKGKKKEGLWTLGYIDKVEITDKVFTYDKKFSISKFAEKHFGVYKEKPFKVEWIFSEVAAPLAEEFIFHPKQKKNRAYE